MNRVSAEVMRSLEVFAAPTEAIPADKVQFSFESLLIDLYNTARIFKHSTTRGSRYPFIVTAASVSQCEAKPLAHPFELVRRKSGRPYRRLEDEVSTVRTLDPARVTTNPVNYGGAWYNPLPTSIHFSRGKNSELWAVFQPNPTDLPNTGENFATRLIEPESPHALVLGYVAIHIQQGIDELTAKVALQ